jgi:putative transposase
MNNEYVGIEGCSRAGRPHADAAIVFGSAASAPKRKPDSVRATCEAIGLPRSTYYYQSHRSASAIEFEQKIVLRLHELRQCKPNDGYRRMTLQLQGEGFHVNRKRIARLMQLHSLTARPTVRDNFLLRHQQPQVTSYASKDPSQASGPSQVWVTDIAYARIGSALVYVAAVIDAWSREVVGYAASLQITNRLVSIALHSAVRAHRPTPGCVHHSTCGSRYLTRSYCELLRQYGLVPSTVSSANRTLPTSNREAEPPHARQIVDVHSYASWKDVIHHPREFVQALYSHERVDQLVGRRTVKEEPRSATSCQ